MAESKSNTGPSSERPLARFQERHYSVAEIAEMWNLSRDVVRNLFQKEAGVFVYGDDRSRSKRGYHTIRIPESIVERVYRRSCNPDLTPTRARTYSPAKSGPPIVGAISGP